MRWVTSSILFIVQHFTTDGVLTLLHFYFSWSKEKSLYLLYSNIIQSRIEVFLKKRERLIRDVYQPKKIIHSKVYMPVTQKMVNENTNVSLVLIFLWHVFLRAWPHLNFPPKKSSSLFFAKLLKRRYKLLQRPEDYWR